MKIVILANSSSGLYGFRKELIEALLQSNEVVALTPDNGRWDELGKTGCSLKEIAVDRRGINPIADVKLLFSYFYELKKIKPDLVITYTIKPNLYGGMVCRLLCIPYAINITGLGTAFERGGMLTQLVTIMYKFACKCAKVVFFENSGNKDIFVNKNIIEEDKTCVLNGAGVNLDKYCVTEYPSGETTKFLFIGRVMAEKGINELFAAMKRLINDGENVELHVLGGFEENYKSQMECFENEGWLYYHGYQEDVRPFIQMAHCFVLPSWHEGMANANLENAASGRPLVTSNIPGCKEAVIDGMSGYLAEAKNADDLYRVMKSFLELSYEERRDMGLAGREYMEKCFDKRMVVNLTMNSLLR